MFCCLDSCGFPAQCVSIPAHLLPFYRSNPNPVKGFGPVASRKGFTMCVSQGPIKTSYLLQDSYVAVVQTPVKGKKKMVSCWEAS